MTDDDPTPEEQREAEALARALQGVAEPAAPRDALETAALVRAAGPAGALSPERGAAVLERIAPALKGPRRRPRWRTAVLAAASVAAAVLGFSVTGHLQITARAPSARRERTWPPEPSAALLAAQARAARGEAPLEAIDAEMRAYRMQVYQALARRYGGAP